MKGKNLQLRLLYPARISFRSDREIETFRDKQKLRELAWKKIFHANGNQKKGGVAIFISDKIDFKIDYYKRQRRTLHNDQGTNPRRR